MGDKIPEAGDSVSLYRSLIVDRDNQVRVADSDDDAIRQVGRHFTPSEAMPLVELWRDGKVIGRVSFNAIRDRT
jgi:hypothetical protein